MTLMIRLKLISEWSIEFVAYVYVLIFFVIIIIVKKDWHWKVTRERLTPYQFEDPNPTIPTHRMNEEKGKNSRRQEGREQLGQ